MLGGEGRGRGKKGDSFVRIKDKGKETKALFLFDRRIHGYKNQNAKGIESRGPTPI
jgi:hypothetical protein